MAARKATKRLFLLLYSSAFSLLALLLAALLLVTPFDTIIQAYRNDQIYNTIIIGGSYGATLLLAVFIYAYRLIAMRRAVAKIPRESIPVRAEDVPKVVHKFIQAELERSVMKSYRSKPPNNVDMVEEHPKWANVRHHGHAPPHSMDLPGVHFEDVIRKLPALLEERTRVSSGGMAMRDYILLLSEQELVEEEAAAAFVPMYERARFGQWCGSEMNEDEFRLLMRVFAAMLKPRSSEDVDDVGQLMKTITSSSSSSGGSNKAGSVLQHELTQATTTTRTYTTTDGYDDIRHQYDGNRDYDAGDEEAGARLSTSVGRMSSSDYSRLGSAAGPSMELANTTTLTGTLTSSSR